MDFIQGHDLYQLIKINKRITEERSAAIIANISDSLNTLTEYSIFKYQSWVRAQGPKVRKRSTGKFSNPKN